METNIESKMLRGEVMDVCVGQIGVQDMSVSGRNRSRRQCRLRVKTQSGQKWTGRQQVHDAGAR